MTKYVLLLIAGTTFCETAWAKSPVTPDLLLQKYSSVMPTPELGWLADSRHLIAVVPERTNPDNNGIDYASGVPSISENGLIEVVDVDSAHWQVLGQGAMPRPSPDGLRIAYLRRVDGEVQVWMMSVDGGHKRALTRFRGGLGATADSVSLAWSSDSRTLAVAYQPPASILKKPFPGPEVTVTVLGEQGQGEGLPDSEVWTVDARTGKGRKVASGPYYVRSLAWIPGRAELIFSYLSGLRHDTDQTVGEIHTVDVAAGTESALVRNLGVEDLRFTIADDGRTLAFTADPTNVVYPDHWRIATIDVHGGPVSFLTGDDIYVDSGPSWGADSLSIYFVCKTGIFTQICRVKRSGGWSKLTDTTRNNRGMALSPDGRLLAWTTEDVHGRVTIRIADSNLTNERVLLDLSPDIDDLNLGEASEIHWKSYDGLQIAGLLIKPLGFQKGKKYPLLVDLHGGPAGGVYLGGSILNMSPLEWQMWAAKGFAVLVADYRSSVIYGWDQILRAREAQEMNARDFNDIMSGVDDVITRGFVDPAKLVVVGHSNGARLVNWIISHSHRFRVAISYEGVLDEFTAYGGSATGFNPIADWQYKGAPWEVPENYRKNSAAEFLKGISTPTLLINGTFGIPRYHNALLYAALRKQGVDSKLIVYAQEGHVIVRRPNQRDLLRRVTNWVDEHL